MPLIYSSSFVRLFEFSEEAALAYCTLLKYSRANSFQLGPFRNELLEQLFSEKETKQMPRRGQNHKASGIKLRD
jgi:hypothetical protein